MQVPLSVFFPGHFYKIVYITDKNCNIDPSQVVNKNNSISGRPFYISRNIRGSNLKKRHCDLPFAKLRHYYKPEKINPSTIPENRFPGNDQRFSGDDSVTAIGESSADFKKLSGHVINKKVSLRNLTKLGVTIINDISNSFCSILYDVPINPLCKDKLNSWMPKLIK